MFDNLLKQLTVLLECSIYTFNQFLGNPYAVTGFIIAIQKEATIYKMMDTVYSFSVTITIILLLEMGLALKWFAMHIYII